MTLALYQKLWAPPFNSIMIELIHTFHAFRSAGAWCRSAPCQYRVSCRAELVNESMLRSPSR